ncbi:MAG: AAA family ATPase [Caldilineales bacterium]|nr:AAA family ATPase [Caldilineales bacterium]
MLTKMIIRNFKRFADIEVDLGNPVVFIGPNNSGKTTALQALALWDAGLRRWNEKRAGRTTPERRPGVTLNRRDLVSVPVPSANLLWRNLHVRDVMRINGKQRTENVFIDILVEGVAGEAAWQCGLEFYYANEESFYCRPMRLLDQDTSGRMQVPEAAAQKRVAYLPPMSGLASNETRLDIGAINVRIGEGRTAEVLRNLCYQIIEGEDGARRWDRIVQVIQSQFLVKLDAPVYIIDRGEIAMTYRTESDTQLDISSAGRGLQQVLLILAHMNVNRDSVLLLDEPDAHLEMLRQRQMYQMLSEVAREENSQIIAASHSEVILNEAADRDVVVAFVGRPHRIDDRGSQVLKALKDIGYDQYYQAEQTGWVLYLEGSTDLAILRAFAKTLNHEAQDALKRPFVSYVLNQPNRARDHFYGLREAKPDLIGIALFDRIEKQLQQGGALRELMWAKRELENYLCQREVLLRWAERSGSEAEGPLFAVRWRTIMEEEITKLEQALAVARRPSPWGADIKASDEFLDPLFENFYQRMQLPNLMRKTDYHILASHVLAEELDQEVAEKLDLIVESRIEAQPVKDNT